MTGESCGGPERIILDDDAQVLQDDPEVPLENPFVRAAICKDLSNDAGDMISLDSPSIQRFHEQGSECLLLIGAQRDMLAYKVLKLGKIYFDLFPAFVLVDDLVG